MSCKYLWKLVLVSEFFIFYFFFLLCNLMWIKLSTVIRIQYSGTACPVTSSIVRLSTHSVVRWNISFLMFLFLDISFFVFILFSCGPWSFYLGHVKKSLSSGSHKWLRFGLWSTMCTVNDCTYLLTYLLNCGWTENHRTQTQYNDMLIIKLFAFQFVNSYTSLFYIAFFRGVSSSPHAYTHSFHLQTRNAQCLKWKKEVSGRPNSQPKLPSLPFYPSPVAGRSRLPSLP